MQIKVKTAPIGATAVLTTNRMVFGMQVLLYYKESLSHKSAVITMHLEHEHTLFLQLILVDNHLVIDKE